MTAVGIYRNDFGCFRIEVQNGAVCSLSISEDGVQTGRPVPALMKTVFHQLDEYFAGGRKDFSVPFCLRGTAFQEKVWLELKKIPYGETSTYGRIAEAVCCPSGSRAVGMACHCNPLMILIPCHRVIGSKRQLTGYAGGLSLKQRLLELEQKHLF